MWGERVSRGRGTDEARFSTAQDNGSATHKVFKPEGKTLGAGDPRVGSYHHSQIRFKHTHTATHTKKRKARKPSSFIPTKRAGWWGQETPERAQARHSQEEETHTHVGSKGSATLVSSPKASSGGRRPPFGCSVHHSQQCTTQRAHRSKLSSPGFKP